MEAIAIWNYLGENLMVENQELWNSENQDKHKYFKHFRIRIP